MISSNKSPKSQNALVRRIQRYAQASTIFRSTEPSGESGSGMVQRSTQSTPKASFLAAPSSLPVGRTVDASGAASMPSESAPFQVELLSAPVMPVSSIDPVTAAISQAEQLQRSYEAQGLSSSTPVSTPSQQPLTPIASPSTPPIVDTSSSIPPVVQKAPEPSDALGNDWNRLQRIFKGHAAKNVPDKASPSASPEIQKQESVETSDLASSAQAVSPPSPPLDPPTDTIQRAVQAAESTPPPTTPRKAPLESMWPVQQVDTPEPANDEPIVMRQPDTPISTEPTQSPAEAETIRRKLGDVSATRPSDSSVELHLPRRPRPASIQAKGQPVDPNKAFWDRMRKAEGKPETVQRTVETEIGPLPADMWEILGETPPGTPTEIPSTGGESTPNIQPKRTESPDDSSPMKPVDTEETNIPSFLAEAATTAPNTPDTLHRAIAAAESTTHEANPETTATPSPVQRKEIESAPTSSAREAAFPSKMAGSEQTVEYNPSPNQESAAEPSIQRATTDTNATLSESGDMTAESVSDTNNAVNTEPDDIPASSGASVTNTTTAVQRAIAAAETAPITDSVENKIQAKQTDSEPTTKTLPTILPQPGPTTSSKTIQRTADSPASQPSGATPQTAVDLNADTAPLPEIPEMPPSQTAVTTPSSQTATPDAIQRAIAAAETAPTPTVEPPAAGLTESNQIQRTADQEQQSTASETLTEAASQTAVTTTPPAQTATPDAIQRAIAAAETTPPPSVEPPSVEPSTDDTVTSSELSASQMTFTTTPSAQIASSDAIQRAIAAVESPTKPSTSEIIEPTAPQMAVPIQPPASPSATIQQIEHSNAPSPPAKPETILASKTQTAVSQPETPAAVQRAIAAAEAPPVSPPIHAHLQMPSSQPTKTPLQPAPSATATRISSQEKIQRAIAAAEMPPTTATKSTMTTSPQTAVATPVKQTSSTTASSLMRAMGQAEGSTTSNQADSTTEPSQETYQWPDIKPTGTQQTQDTIQRDPSETVDFGDTQADMQLEENSDEDSANVNVEQLANAVYSQLRKRLAIEWERGRGKR